MASVLMVLFSSFSSTMGLHGQGILCLIFSFRKKYSRILLLNGRTASSVAKFNPKLLAQAEDLPRLFSHHLDDLNCRHNDSSF